MEPSAPENRPGGRAPRWRAVSGPLLIWIPVLPAAVWAAHWGAERLSRQVTSAVSSVIGDQAVTIALAFVPLTIVGLQVEDFRLFWLSLVFVALMPALHAGFIHFGEGHGFRRWHIGAPGAAHLPDVLLVAPWGRPFGSGG